MKTDIYKVENIGIGFLAVMANPIAGNRAGDKVKEEFIDFANLDIKQVVSLLELDELEETGLEDEEVLTVSNGMDFISFPIKDKGVPISVEEFSNFSKLLYHQIASGKNTVIHCREGIGRTGLLAASILFHCGFEPVVAFRHIFLKTGVLVPDTIQQSEWLELNYSEIVSNTLGGI